MNFFFFCCGCSTKFRKSAKINSAHISSTNNFFPKGNLTVQEFVCYSFIFVFETSFSCAERTQQARDVRTTLHGRCYDVKTLKRRHNNVVLTPYAGWEEPQRNNTKIFCGRIWLCTMNQLLNNLKQLLHMRHHNRQFQRIYADNEFQ